MPVRYPKSGRGFHSIGGGPSSANFRAVIDDAAAAVLAGLVLYLDAQMADGTNPPSSGSLPGTWTDLSGNANDGTLTNINGNASSGWNGDGTPSDPYHLQLDGSNDYVEIADDATLQIDGDITIAVTINPQVNGTDNDWHCLIAKRGGGASEWEMFLQNAAAGGFYNGTNPLLGGAPAWYSSLLSNYAIPNGTSVAALNTWQEVCVVVSGTTITFYINGVAVGTDTVAANTRQTNTNPVFIGQNGGAAEYMQTKVARVLVYDRALTPAEVAQNFESIRERVNI